MAETHQTPEERALIICRQLGFRDATGSNILEIVLAALNDAYERGRADQREAILQLLPGGTHCDLQDIADAIGARSMEGQS